MNVKILVAGKPKGLNRVAKLCKGYQCVREIDITFDKLTYLGTVNKDIFLLELYLIKHDSAGVMNIEWIIPSMTNINGPSAETLIQ